MRAKRATLVYASSQPGTPDQDGKFAECQLPLLVDGVIKGEKFTLQTQGMELVLVRED